MTQITNFFYGTTLAFGSCAFMPGSAGALTAPTPIEIDVPGISGVVLSGGADGYAYVQGKVPGSLRDNGFEAGSALIEFVRRQGLIRFVLKIGAQGSAPSLGAPAPSATVNAFSTGPLHTGYLTLSSPNGRYQFSAGQLGSIEGFESGQDWQNFTPFTTEIYYTEAGDERGVEASYNGNAFTTFLSFTDGYDTGVFNYLQGLSILAVTAHQSLNFYFGCNLGRTGLAAHTYGENYGDSTVASYGAWFANSNMVGGWYQWNDGALELIGEVQYQVAKVDAVLGLHRASSNIGMALMANYAIPGSAFSLGGWVENWVSDGPDNWFIGPKSAGEAVSAALIWQHGPLFVQGNIGLLHLRHIVQGDGFGAHGAGRLLPAALLDAGIWF